MITSYRNSLDEIAQQGGMLGCAIVETESGMVVEAAGDEEWAARAEAAVDFWRLYERRADLRPLGPPRAAVLIHPECRITLTSCGARMVLICFSSEPDTMDWPAWKLNVGRLTAATRSI